ncbi:NAD/NADP-dependent betaine aldehyde dehydrogenase [Polaromonas vacuolata]|uniref:NAD/NADP-dependent betaine aldehyde dehydrogenase n=1 Tax=Polaromonas vacuolata TaxID=37448 RepID=A0A6H2HA71_9BURK|nr:NAD/NADP-dependent betaine aldehyde dehydrogenase [Polaromonas vacuolata]
MPAISIQQLYIHGARVDATSGEVFTTLNPATGEVLAQVQAASQQDVERAVASATKGQRVWAAFTAMERSRVLRRAVEILRERNDELADLETLDTGKPVSENSLCRYCDRRRCAGVLRWPSAQY